MIDVQVKGMDETLKFFKKFPENIQKNVMKGAMKAGAKVIEKEAKHNVKVESGNLRDSIDVIPRRSKDKNIIHFSVAPRINKTKTKRFRLADGTKWSIKGQVASGWYGHMVEFGTSKMAAKPFLRPAESKSDEAFDVTKKYIQKRVPKEIEKAKR